MKKERIWEIDAARGLFILFVFLAHLSFDLRAFLGWQFDLGLVQLLFDYGGVLFILLSGISATLGSRSFRRGLIVLACGMVITAVTSGMIALDMLDPTNAIYFGVLHLLGTCMIVYPLLKKLPTWLLAVLGVVLIGVGYWLDSFYLPNANDWTQYLFILGLKQRTFAAGDYFPILPHLGWFTLGIVIGRTIYAAKTTRFSTISPKLPPIRFLTFCGRHSLELYLIHQPIIYGIVMLIAYL